jgi:thioredoxin-like negative regulator of GroEL
VQGIPTLLLVNQGKIVNRVVGALPEAKLKTSVKYFLDQIAAPAPGLATPGGS